MYLSFNMPGLRKQIFISPVSFAKSINYLNHVICNGSVSRNSWVIKLVCTDFCKGPIVPLPELRISSNKNLKNLQRYDITRILWTLFESDQEKTKRN